MRVQSLLGCLIAALSLWGCGGGGGAGISTPPSRPPPSPPPQTVSNAEGIWTGTALVRCDVYSLLGLVTRENGLFISTPVGVYVGSIRESIPRIDAVKYNRQAEVPMVLTANTSAKPLRLTGVQAKSHLGVEWEPAPAEFCTQGRSSLRYDYGYERPASLALIAGVYTDGSLTIAVNSDGALTGSEMSGCVLNGNVEVVHADRNYYSVVVDVDNCAAAGNYEGAAFFDDAEEGGTSNELVFIAANPLHAIWRMLVK